MSKCPVCSEELLRGEDAPKIVGASSCSCKNCGTFEATRQAVCRLEDMNVREKAAVSHHLWRSQKNGREVMLQSHTVEQLGQTPLPRIDEQLENAVLFWGDSQGENYGGVVRQNYSHLLAKLGAQTCADARFVIEEAQSRKLLEKTVGSDRFFEGRLTFEGWEKYRSLQRGKSEGHLAFMAMPFGQAEVTDMVENVFRPAVAATGFVLRRLDDEAPAGLIDNRMRVEIRRSRFVIADLTHENRGAYWEAGYAEGLGKPVIYTCKKSYFKRRTTHFDTNHCLTVLWDPAAPEWTADNLKATIRATFPFDAQMDPDPLS